MGKWVPGVPRVHDGYLGATKEVASWDQPTSTPAPQLHHHQHTTRHTKRVRGLTSPPGKFLWMCAEAGDWVLLYAVRVSLLGCEGCGKNSIIIGLIFYFNNND